MSPEILGYFLRYLLPAAIGLVSVIGLSALTRSIPVLLGGVDLADPLEIFAYSILTTGPFVFSGTFLVSFFWIAHVAGQNDWAKRPLSISVLYLALVVLLHFILLPRR